MSVRIGLTGSIGMGKSTTAGMFADRGCAVWDADAAVHRLYGPGGAATAPMAQLFPQAVSKKGVDRDVLKTLIAADPTVLTAIEGIVHPLVAKDRAQFADGATADFLVFDIPLLFEKNSQTEFDATVCVHVDADTQRARVLARPGMTQEQLEHILSRQMPSAEKCALADYVIDTSSLDTAAEGVDTVLADLRGRFDA